MAKTPKWFDEGWGHVWHPYAQMQTMPQPLPVVSAEGCKIKLADGTELIDGIASWWSMCHGYQNPHIVKAISDQANTLSHVMFAGLAHEPGYTLAKRLCTFTNLGMERVFFCESGSVSVEVALKMALQYWRNKGDTRRTKFITFERGYHGDTMGAMSVSAKSHFNSAYDSLTLKNYTLTIPEDEYSFAEFADTLKAIHSQIAALIIEPLVQGAGGFHFYSPDILSEIRRVCREYGILFIADEIATGFARTGSMFACHEAAIEPDILCLGKALTGGHMPLAATLTNKTVFDAFLSDDASKALMHGPTFMAHPIACAAANASLDLFEKENYLAKVEKIEAQLWEGLKGLEGLPTVKDVRVKGAIGVVELNMEEKAVRALRPLFTQHGLWIRPFERVVYLMPPLLIHENHVQALVAGVRHVLSALKAA